MINASTASASLEELLSLHDSQFITAAYLTILKRPVDDDGLAGYLRHLRDGMSKAELLAVLARSPEGQAANCQLPGLTDLIAATSPVPVSMLTRILKMVGTERKQDTGRQLTRVENQLGRLMLDSAVRLGRLESAVADLRLQCDHHHQALVNMLATSQVAKATLIGPAPAHCGHSDTNATAAGDEDTWDEDLVERVRRLLHQDNAS